jgi:arabinan endo-1,5-alpha-L-arabinosidase
MIASIRRAGDGHHGRWRGLLAGVVLGCSGLITFAAESAASSDSEEQGSAVLSAAGKRQLRVHDPSTIVKEGDVYWLFSTGRGVSAFRSLDLIEWERGPSVFPVLPDWITEVAASQRGHFWAPDVIRQNDRYWLYYSVSAFGKNTSAIALATSPTLNPDDGQFGWKDEGIVVRSEEQDNFNAIDPAVTRDEEGRLWMSFGSFWSGIKLIELDPATGHRIAPDAPMHALARKKEIEAPAIYRHEGYYYLFVNWGICCRGVNSTYNVRVGRSQKITGPYVDRDGVDLREGGGTLFLESEGPFFGPGHVGIFEEEGHHWVSVHFYDGTNRGQPTLALRPIRWEDDGWPVAGKFGP